jgi:transitional endoplasmic reticulum ATPase
MDSKENSSHVSLRVSETDPKFVGRGIALVDPKAMIELGLSTGDVIEISGNRRKTHVLLWSSQQQDFGRKLIRVDGYTRNNLGIGLQHLDLMVDTFVVRLIEMRIIASPVD